MEDAGVDVNKATNEVTGSLTPLHFAVINDHINVAVCLMERGMAFFSRTRDGQHPIDLALTEGMRQAIVNEEKSRRDHGFKRSVIPPNPSTTTIEEEEELATNQEEGEAADEEDDDDEDSMSSDEEDDN